MRAKRMKLVNMTSSLSKREKDPAEAFQAAEEAFNFIAAAIEDSVVIPRDQAGGAGWHHRHKAQIQGQLPHGIAFVSPIHDPMTAGGRRAHGQQQGARFRRIGRLTRGQAQAQGASSICGNQMNLGGPATMGFADGLRAVFF